MNLEKWIESSEANRRKYAYYLGLGFSARAAQVLSALTYGGARLASAARMLGGERVLDKFHDWLQTREEDDPETAILAAVAAFSHEESREEARSGSGRQRPRRAKKLREFGDGGTHPEERVMRCLVNRSYSGPVFCEKAERDEEPDEPGGAGPAADGGAGPCSAAQPEAGHPAYSAKPHGMELSRLMRRELREALATDAYEPIEEKGAADVFTAPTSTFRMTTNSASMGIVFNQLRSGRAVRLDQVRIEEILNYFDYDAQPPQGAKFAVSTELLPKKDGKKLLFVLAQAAEETKEHRNVVLLLDVSGSMYGNREVTQEAVAAVISRLRPGDRLSLVTYSFGDQIVFEGREIRQEQDREELMGAIFGIDVSGSTWGSAGIQTAYAVGEKYFRPDWNNQVILITDGDLNFGITEKHGLEKLIEEKKKSGLFLSVVGTGLWNYKDDKLETLSRHGNGTYCVVNALEDVEESVVRRFAALTHAVAKDVKAQVEFNPRFVKNYRLLGYENRRLNHEDFKNDAVISEPYGSGGHGVALYELELRTGAETQPDAGLKYQAPVLKDSDELCTVSVRWKEPLGEESTGVEAAVHDADNGGANAQLAYFLYCLSEELRGSGRLDGYDREFLGVTLTSRLYRSFAGPNREKLELLAAAYGRRVEREADQAGI